MMIKKILLTLSISIFSLFSINNAFSAWIQEDMSIAGNTTLKSKIEYLKDITENGVVSQSRINYNIVELQNLFTDGKVSNYVKNDYQQAIVNNLYYVEIGGQLKRSYFGYKNVDGVDVFSLDKDFLIEIQKNVDGTYRDVGRTDSEAEQIAIKIQLFFDKYINPTGNTEYSLLPKAFVFNHYSFVTSSKSSGMAINSIFEDICNGFKDKTTCIENQDGGIIAIGYRDSTDPLAINQSEYKENVANYEIAGKTQIPSALKSRLEYLCPVTTDKPINWFVENNALDQCGLTAHDFDCDGKNEWIDINDSLKTTTVYAINVSSDILSVQVILYLNGKEIVKLYNTPAGCYSHLLTKEWDDVSSSKTIYKGFNGNDIDNKFLITNGNINGDIIGQHTISSNQLTISQYNFFSTNQIQNTGIQDNYQINVDVKDTKPQISSDNTYGLIALSSTNGIDGLKLKIYMNQDVFGFENAAGTAKLLFGTKENGMTNNKQNTFQIKITNGIAFWYINGKKYFSFDIANNAVTLENGVKQKELTGIFSVNDFKLQQYVLFSNQFTSGAGFSKEYSNFSITKPDSSKLYLYKLNQSADVENYYLGQIIDTVDYNYDFLNNGTSTDQICKSFVKKDGYYFDDNTKNNGNSYIGYNTSNGCNFLGKKVYFYGDLNGKLSYLKKIYVSGNYNISNQLFDFQQSEENLLQGADYGTILSGIIKTCNMTQVINNELDTCSELHPIDVDNDGWNEWILAKDGEFEVYNNVITENILGDYTPSLELMYKSAGNTYCTLLQQNIDYYKSRSIDSKCNTSEKVDLNIVTNGNGTKELCESESALVMNGVNDYQFIYGIIGSNKDDKKYNMTQILKNKPIVCD